SRKRNLLLGVEQFAQKLSGERHVAGQHDPFNDSEGVACAGDDLGAARWRTSYSRSPMRSALISRRTMGATLEGSAAAMQASTYDRTPGGAPQSRKTMKAASSSRLRRCRAAKAPASSSSMTVDRRQLTARTPRNY